MNPPEQQQIDHWLKNGQFQIERAWRLNREGFHEKNDVSLQSVYTSVALDHASLARAKFLNGDAIDAVRTEFANAARCVLKSFTMAYDETDPDYQGGKADLSCVSETIAIDGFDYALMAADLELAAELARVYRDRPDGYMLDIDVNRYAHALKQTLLGGRQQAWDLLKAQLDDYVKNPPKSVGDKNYATLITTLFGILNKDQALFNEGLAAQLKFYQGYAQGELKDTDEEFICDHAVALANLGLHKGLTVTVAHDTLPKGLFLQL